MNYKFVLVDAASGQDEREWVLATPVTVGRCPTANMTIGDASISRQHCEFLMDPYGSLTVRDLGSKNGVFVDERRVDHAVVRPGTEVRIGAITLRVELTEDELVDEPDEAEIFDLDADLGETQPVKIVRPEAQG